MTRAESRALRLVQLIALLDAHRHGLSVQDIASHLGVSRFQVYRDLTGLESIGFPIVCPSPGVYALMTGYRVPSQLAAA